MKKYLFSLFFLLTYIVIQAQSEEWKYINDYNFHINDYLQKDAFMWLGTSSGLIKLDLVTKESQKIDYKGTSLKYNSIVAVEKDVFGNIYIATCTSIFKYDGINFEPIAIDSNPDENFCINDMKIELNGDIWIATSGSGGIASYNGNSWTFYNIVDLHPYNNYVLSIEIDQFNNKWFGSNNSLIKFDNVNWYVYDYQATMINFGKIESIDVDNNGAIWFTSLNTGLIKFEDDLFHLYNRFTSDIPEDSLNFVFIDNLNQKWIGTKHCGLVKFDDSNWTIFNVDNSDLVSDNVTCITQDIFANIWIGIDADGTVPTRLMFLNMTGDFSKWTDFIYSLPRSGCYCIAKGIDNSKWIGTGGGLVKYDANNNPGYFFDKEEIVGVSITNIAADALGNVYINVVDRSEIIKMNEHEYIVYSSDNQDFPEVYVRCLHVDNFNNLWVGTATNGLLKFDGETWSNYNTTNSGIPNNTIVSIDSDNDGNIWVASCCSGIGEYSNGVWTNYNSSNSALPNNEMRGISVFDDGVWVCSSAYFSIFSENAWTIYEQNQIISENTGAYRYSFEDNENARWLYMSGGILRMKEGVWTLFTEEDAGFEIDNFYDALVDDENNKWFCASQGLVILNDGSQNKIEENYNNPNEIELFPNPVNDVLNINLNGKVVSDDVLSLRIYNISGVCCMSEVLNKDKTAIDMSEFDKGIYFLQIISGENSDVLKFVKQ